MSAPISGTTGATQPNVMGIAGSIALAVVSAFGLVGTIIFGPQTVRGNLVARGQYPSGMPTDMPSMMPTPGRGPGGGGGMRGNGGMAMVAPLSTWNIVVIVLFALILVGSIVFLILALRSRPTPPAVIPVVAVAGMPGYAPVGVTTMPAPVVADPGAASPTSASAPPVQPPVADPDA